MIMPVRTAATEVPIWEVLLSGGLMVLAVVGILRVGGLVYERAVLRTGKRLKITEVLRGEVTT